MLPTLSEDVVRYLREYSESELREIGRRAQQRVLEEHTSVLGAQELEAAITRGGGAQPAQTEASGIKAASAA